MATSEDRPASTRGVSVADRYIVQEILAPFLLGVGAFLVILVGDILYTLAEFIATRRVGIGPVLQLLMYKLPAILVITFPVSTLIGALLGLGRLAKDNEIRAMRLAGMSLVRIFTPVLLFGVAIAGVTLGVNEFVAPWANHKANDLIRRAAFSEAFPKVREQVFFRGPDARVFYIGSVDDTRGLLRNVMIYELERPLPRLITAQLARWDRQVWHLLAGVVREFDDQGFTRYEAAFSEMDILVGIEGTSFFAGQKTPEEMTARELREYLALFGHGLGSAAFNVEYYRKFAVPFASAIFALLAAPLGVRTAQGGRFVGVGTSIVLLFIYYVLMSVAKAIGTVGALPPFLAAWSPNFCFGLAGVLLWVHEDGKMGRRVGSTSVPSTHASS
jgi:LPS export ABC transporter permease LptG